MACAFGQGDIDYLSVENGSPADDHDRGAALVVGQTGSRSTGLTCAGCATAKGRSSSRFGGRSFTRWVITSDAPTPGWASSDGKSAVSIPLVSDVRTAQPITLVGPRLLAHGPSERHVRRSSPAMAHDRVLLIAAIGAGISLLPDASSEPRCQYVWASPHYRSQERTRVTSVRQERRRRVARNAGGQGPTTSTQRWSIVGCPRPVSRAVVPEPASSVIPRSVGVIGMAAHASERALVLRCLRLPAARSSRPRAFQNSG